MKKNSFQTTAVNGVGCTKKSPENNCLKYMDKIKFQNKIPRQNESILKTTSFKKTWKSLKTSLYTTADYRMLKS